EELKLSVIESPFTLNNIGGAKALKEFTMQLIEAEKAGYKAKGIFLVGIPGTGKTFFPKCFAGELKRKLILLNLSQIMESEEPIQSLNRVFEFLHKRCFDYPDEKFVILIDEIEKMIGNVSTKEKQMLGRLLTILNDINTPACEYRFNAIFFATANDLNTILSNNPEFLRRGRWDEL
ncbi:ATP-binding protein, partial [Campylobacter jejuni]|nr:ATP-binding protein [Campylobacter jejuni]